MYVAPVVESHDSAISSVYGANHCILFALTHISLNHKHRNDVFLYSSQVDIVAKPLERYCAFCGRAFDDAAAPWPRHCNCGVITYRNPLPVVNVIVPVKDGDRTGVLLIRRGIDPCRGQWAFPGGFMELHETWREGGARELREETGIKLEDWGAQPESIRLLHVSESPRLDEIIVIGVTPMRDIDAMPSIPINEEVIETRIAYAPETLAFPAHTEAMAAFFDPSRSILYHA